MSTGLPRLEDGFLRPEEVEEIRQTFFDQARAALDALGPQVLALEGHLPTRARLQSLRRAAHTLKGDCSSVGFPESARLAHALEDAFTQLEGGRRAVSAEQGDVLLAAVDRLGAGLEAGAAGRAEPDVEPVLAALSCIAAPGQGAAGALLTDGEASLLAEGLTRGLYAVEVVLEFSPGVRRREDAVQRAIERAELDLVRRVPSATSGRPARVTLLALAPFGADVVRERLPGTRGVRLTARDWRREAAGGAPLQEAAPESQRGGETVRIESRRVDEVLNLIGEMVTARSTIAGVTAEIEPLLSEELAARLAEAQSLLERVLQDLQRSAMRMRMVPAGRVFRRFGRAVRDLARRTGKAVALVIEGETTELDRGILDALEEPLLHLVRNAVDHGIEAAEERRTRGKPEEGRVTLRASREGNQVLVEVEDDGRGIDAAAVRAATVARGLLAPGAEEGLSEDESLQLVFSSGLSTAAAVTETSGRGVGLDIVREKVEALKGSIRASNRAEGGASFVIRVPLTVAIIQALLFRAAGKDLAVPLTSVVEIARASAVSVQRVGVQEMFRLRDKALMLVRLGALLAPETGSATDGYVIVLQSSIGRFGILVDELVNEQELVIKAVHDRWIRTPLVAGASALGGGVLALILDVLAVHRAALGRGALLGA